MTLNAPSFRLPFNLPEDLDPEVRRALEFTFNGLTVHEQAFRALKLGTTVTNNTTVVTGGGGGGGTVVAVGGVNDQIGVTAYTTQQSDNGVKIIVGDSLPIVVTLNGGVTTPWFCIIDNDSSSVASLNPSGATLHGEVSVPPGGFGIVCYDGAVFWSGAIRIGSDFYTGYVQGDGVTIHVDSTTGIMSTTGVFDAAYRAITAPTTILSSDYQIEVTANTFTQPLPTAVGITGKVYSIKNTGTGTVTVDPAGSETIDGNLTMALLQWDNLTIMSNNAGWIIL